MVTFNCDNCGGSVKKNKLQQHESRCRSDEYCCVVCVDTFNFSEATKHFQCISEAERVQGSDYKGPRKGEAQTQQKTIQPDTKKQKTSDDASELVQLASTNETKKDKKDKKEKKEKKEKKDKKDSNPALLSELTAPASSQQGITSLQYKQDKPKDANAKSIASLSDHESDNEGPDPTKLLSQTKQVAESIQLLLSGPKQLTLKGLRRKLMKYHKIDEDALDVLMIRLGHLIPLSMKKTQ